MDIKTYKIAVLPGDGIGPEITEQALRVLRTLEKATDSRFECTLAEFGASAYFSVGKSFPEKTKKVCDEADAIIKGPIGLSHKESEKIPLEEQPERGALLPLRRRYNTYANFRPIYLPKGMAHFSPLKPEIVGEGIDIMLIRELVGGVYFGDKEQGRTKNGLRYVKETLEYDEGQIHQIMQVAFQEARNRKKVLHNIHKKNVLMSSVLWNEVLAEVAEDFPDVHVEHMLVDAAATHLCLKPTQFDVMVMENMFGDILSDQGGGILGSLGLMPSACMGPKKAYYEPSHGSAPDIAGKNLANPYSMIGSVAMMLDKSFGLDEQAHAVWRSMHGVFEAGYTTADLSRPDSNIQPLSTTEFGDKVVEALEKYLS